MWVVHPVLFVKEVKAGTAYLLICFTYHGLQLPALVIDILSLGSCSYISLRWWSHLSLFTRVCCSTLCVASGCFTEHFSSLEDLFALIGLAEVFLLTVELGLMHYVNRRNGLILPRVTTELIRPSFGQLAHFDHLRHVC